MSGTCNCDGSVTGVFQALPDSVYHAAGTTTPTEDAVTACMEAVSVVRAQGLDPCDPDSGLQDEYSNALDSVHAVVSTEPASNVIQLTADQLAGTAAPGTTVAPGTKKPQPSSNTTFIIGAIVILAIGFLLVFR